MKKKALILISILLCILLSVSAVLYFAVYRPKQIRAQEHLEAVLSYRASKTERFLSENEKYGDYEVEVAFLGDSLTDGYDLEKFYPDILTVNRGIGGDTTFDLEARLQVSVLDLKPKVAVMLIGANNLSTMLDNYENILISLKDNLPETEIVLLSLTNMGQDWGKGNQLAAYNNTRIKKLAEKYGFTFIDIYTPLMNAETGEIVPEYTTDGGHLTQKGYEVLTSQITPVLKAILNAA